MEYSYLLSVSGFLVIPAIVFYFLSRKHIDLRALAEMFLIYLPFALAFSFFGTYFRAWVFPPEALVGVYLWILPLEDLLFVIAAGILAISLYEFCRKR
ncbi:hypothetical protein HY991_02420 [Candidatus Micrarchaeota archaeon]|nr:hypothetical protein [Candidatus Micrarchaeota archaeon]